MLPDADSSVAADVNEAGLIVGSSGDHPLWTSSHAFLYEDGRMVDLNDLIIDPENEWHELLEAYAINNHGEIVGYGVTADDHISAFVLVPYEEPKIPFIRGDPNEDGTVNIADAIFILTYQFAGGDEASCMKSADTNDDGGVGLADAIYVLTYQFSNGPDPKPPFSACGLDTTPENDDVSCVSYARCD